MNLKRDLSGTAPILSLDGQRGKLDPDLSAPAINGNLPNLSVNKPSLNVGSQLSKPSFGVTGPEVKGGLGGPLNVPAVPPPQLSAPSASLDVKNPDVKTGSLKFERPKFSMPNFNLPQVTPEAQAEVSADAHLPQLEAPNLSLDPRVDIKGPKAGLTGPNFDVNGPGANLQSPNVDADGHLGKFKWPHQKWKVPKGKGLEADLSTPDLNVSTPGVATPGVDLNAPGVDIRGPGLDAPNVDADPPSGKIMWPHLKWKKPKGLSTDVDLEGNLSTAEVSGPNLQSELRSPDIDINVPKAELGGPNVDMQAPNVNMEAPSGKINWPHLKWKKPRGSRPDLDLDPDLNLSTPNIAGEMNTTSPGLKVPKAGLASGVDVHVPDADIDVDNPSGKINWPHLKWKKPNLHGPKADVDLNPDLSSPDVDVSLPNVNAPDVDLNLAHPNVDVKAPNLNVDPPSGKFKWPTLKKSKIKTIDPNLDLDLGADVSVPDPELSGPDVNLSLPKANAEAPKLDLDSPDIEGPLGKFKWFNFKKPKFGTLKGPKADFDADVKAPELALGAPDVGLKTADINLSSPNIEANPDLSVRMPNGSPSGPDVELPDGKLHLPQWKLPNLRGSNVGAPELNADVSAPDIDANTTFGAPNLSLSAPNVTPDLKGVDLSGDLQAPDLSLSTPNAAGVNLNVPKADLEAPTLDLDAPDIDGPSGKLKWFNFKKPKIGTLKGGQADVDAEVEPPHVDPSKIHLGVSSPQLNGDLSLPDADVAPPRAQLHGPSAQLPTPDIAPDPQLGDFKLPHFKLPQLQNPTVRSGIEGPTVAMTPGNVEGAIPTASVDARAPALSVDPPKATFKSPGMEAGAPPGALQAPPPVPEATASEGADAKRSPQSKLRWPFKWGLNAGSGTDDEGSGFDSDPEASTAAVPAFKFHQLPKMNLDGIPEMGNTSGVSRQDTEAREYVVSKGIRLPVVNATSKPGEKISVLERLQMAKGNTPPAKPGLKAPEGSATSDDMLSLGLSYMLGLNLKGSA